MRRAIYNMVMLVALTGCGDNVEEALETQHTAIKSYLNGRSLVYDMAGGVYRHVANADREDYDLQPAVAWGDEVWFDFEARLFENGPGKLFYTNKPALIADMNGSESLSWPVDVQKVRLGTDLLLRGVADGMTGCRTGDSVALFIPSDQAYGGHETGVVPRNTAIVYVLNISNVIKP